MGLMRLQRWPGSHGQPGKKNIVSCGVGAWQRGVDKVAGSTPALFPEHDGARWESGNIIPIPRMADPTLGNKSKNLTERK